MSINYVVEKSNIVHNIYHQYHKPINPIYTHAALSILIFIFHFKNIIIYQLSMSKTAKFISSSKKSSQLVLELSKYYDYYLDEKKNLLNHPKIVEYLFNKPLINISCLADLMINYDSDVKIVRLEDLDTKKIKFNFFGLIELLRLYSNKYDHNKLPHRIQINYLPILVDLDRNKVTIMKILDKLENKKIISYVYQWSFTQEGSHLSALKSATVNFENEIIYDFFGVHVYRSKMDLFVIQFDDESHFNSKLKSFFKIHINDIYMQFILFQMNIHLLRLNTKSNFSKEICNFLNKIKKSTEYVSINPIKPLKKIIDNTLSSEAGYSVRAKISDFALTCPFRDKASRTRLQQSRTLMEAPIPIINFINFSQDFNYNRNNVYLLLRPKKNELYDSEDDNYINFLINECNTDVKTIPEEESIIISNNNVKKIIKENESMYGKSLSRADNIIVELIGNKYEKKISINDIFNSIGSDDSNDNIEVNDNEIYDLVFSKNKPKSKKAIVTTGFNFDKFSETYKPKKS
jgi:hypothetical protein